MLSLILGGWIWAQEAPPLTEKDCPTVDLSAQFGPVRNQGKIGSCFAFAMADLIGYAAHLTPQNQVSAIDVQMGLYAATEEQIRASIGKQSKWGAVRQGLYYLPNMIQAMADFKATLSPTEAFNGGIPWLAAMAYNVRKGACTESQLPSTGPQAFVSSDFFVRDQINKFSYGEIKNPDFLMTKWQAVPYVGSLDFLNFFKYRSGSLQTQCPSPGNSLRRSAEYIDGIYKQVFQDMDQKLEKTCSPRTPIPPIMSMIRSFKNEGAKQAAELLRTKPPLPFGWSYDPRFLEIGAEAAGPRQVNSFGHNSVVVGMHWDGKQCQFKVRNSWGIRCDIYHESLRDGCHGGVLDVPADLFDKYSISGLIMHADDNSP